MQSRQFQQEPTLFRDQPPTQHVDIDAERVRFVYRTLPTGLLANLIVALIVLWVFNDRVAAEVLSDWFYAILLVVLVRALTLYRYYKVEINSDNLSYWYSVFLTLSTLTGVIWGSTIWFFGPYENLETPLLISFVLGGLTAGASAILGAVSMVYFSYVWAILLPLMLWFFLQNISSYYVMGLMVAIYIVVMMAAGYLYRRVFSTSIMLANQFIEAKEQAEIANQAKSHFLSSMSHELRTPLNAILGFSQMIKLDKSLSANSRKYINDVYTGGTHLLKLIEGLLDLAKIEAHRIDLKFTHVNCHDLLAECVELIQPLCQQYQVTLNYTPSETLHTVWADQFRLKQVVLNLLSNACKYNKPGGTVTLCCESSANQGLRISVADTGIGIASNKQEKLFQVYQRLGYENSIIEGSGLGLTIVKQLVEMMHGQIGFESELDKGSTFWVEFSNRDASVVTAEENH